MPCLDCGRPGVRGRCTDCLRAKDQQRGSADERGYGTEHRQKRAAIQAQIDAGEHVACVTCDVQLHGTRWDLGHVPGDPTAYVGPQCWPCNRGHLAAVLPAGPAVLADPRGVVQSRGSL